MYLVGAGSHARDIAAIVGGSDKSSWIGSSVPILAVVLSCPISQAADLWGRKWFLVGLTALGGVGCIITSRANSMSMAIAGGVIAAVSFGAQPLVIAIPSEVLPRRLRPIAQATSNIIGVMGAIFGLLVGGALTRHGHPEGFRTYWYIAAGFYFASALACALLYNPHSTVAGCSESERENEGPRLDGVCTLVDGFDPFLYEFDLVAESLPLDQRSCACHLPRRYLHQQRAHRL